MKRYLFLIVAMIVLLTGCSSGGQIMDGDGMVNSFHQISQDAAKEMMEKDDGHVIVDVRRQGEYDAGHIPGAILIPNESITDVPPKELPDLNQTILVYCRTGRRSKEAAQKLFDMGYTNVYEFGGIETWDGEIVSEELTALQPIHLKINDAEVPVSWEQNASVAALRALLPLTISLHMYEDFEQVGPLGTSLESEDTQTTTDAGDIVLYSGDQIVLFYGSNFWAYTRLGHIELTKQEIVDLLSNGDVRIQLYE